MTTIKIRPADRQFRLFPLTLVLLIFASLVSTSAEPDQGFLSGWKFLKGDSADAVRSGTETWETVNLPHTWNAEDAADGGGFEPPGEPGYYRGPGWYAKSFSADPSWKGRRVFLRFEGVGASAVVYLNGKELGHHDGLGTGFVFEITPALRFDGTNDLRVRADNTLRPDVAPLSGDFPVFGGIYRPVSVFTGPKTCISPLEHGAPGVSVRQREVGKDKALLDVVTLIDHGGSAPVRATVGVRVLDGEKVVASGVSPGIPLAANARGEGMVTVMIPRPHLWNGRKDPFLYRVETRLMVEGKEVDRFVQETGVRSYRIDPQNGFFLNGEPYPLYGVCRHQDRAGKGWAVSEADLKEDVSLILEMGARAVRLAHYPHSDAFYTLCDRAGLLVWTEIPVVDKISNDPGFAPNAKKQLVEMIRQLRNHPSIFTWGISNELFHRPTPDGIPLMRELNELAKREDPTRPTTIAVNKKRADLCNITDLLAFNAYPGWYEGTPQTMGATLEAYQKLGGNRGVGISEYGAGASLRHHEQNPKKPVPGSKWHPEEWQAVVHEGNWRSIREAKFCWGSFVWNMFDFASVWRNEGDTPGMNDKGIVTYDRKSKKDAFYFYQANWSDAPVLHLASKRHTDRKETATSVKVYTNAPEVTLMVNGKNIGTTKPDDIRVARWDAVSLAPGRNAIEVRATIAGKPLVDRAEWNLVP